MNRVVLESSPVQQMMAGNPNLWNINTMRPPPHQSSPIFPSNGFLPQYSIPTNSSLSSSSPLSMPCWHENQELPESWSQLLPGGVVAEEDKRIMNHLLPKKFEYNWEEQQLFHQGSRVSGVHDVKQEHSANSYAYGHHHASDVLQAVNSTCSPIHMIPVSSPQSCITSLSSNNNMLDFASNKAGGKRPHLDQSSECNSNASGGASKKSRVQSSSQSTFKVRKEKLGDRITALHQIVSPFGKTDTASVLLEAIGYIRFLQSQIEALSLPYLSSESSNMRQPQTVQGERNCIFPEDPGQLLNDNSLKKKVVSEQEGIEEPKKDLKTRGLCLVPIQCTMQVGSDNAADYWAPAFNGEFRQI